MDCKTNKMSVNNKLSTENVWVCQSMRKLQNKLEKF